MDQSTRPRNRGLLPLCICNRLFLSFRDKVDPFFVCARPTRQLRQPPNRSSSPPNLLPPVTLPAPDTRQSCPFARQPPTFPPSEWRVFEGSIEPFATQLSSKRLTTTISPPRHRPLRNTRCATGDALPAAFCASWPLSLPVSGRRRDRLPVQACWAGRYNHAQSARGRPAGAAALLRGRTPPHGAPQILALALRACSRGAPPASQLLRWLPGPAWAAASPRKRALLRRVRFAGPL